jgi:25S rRNA (cytosine2278-C5)-methyltransferase
MNNYLQYANVIREIESKRKNFKSVIFDLKKRNAIKDKDFAKVYRVSLHISKNLTILKKAMTSLQNEKKMEISNPYLFIVLLNEFFFGKYKEIKGGGKLKRIILENEAFLSKHLKSNENSQGSEDLLIKDKVYLRYSSPIDIDFFKQKLQSISSLENEQLDGKIKMDQHIPNLVQIDYSIYSKALSTLRQESSLSNFVIQGKSSCFPVYLLFKKLQELREKKIQKPLRFDVIDACAAPGNKTIQISEYVGASGRVFAFEKNPERAEILRNRLIEHNITNVKVFNKDFLKINPSHKLFKKVKFIVADPSCSGTGMLNQIFVEKKNDFQNDFENFCKQQFDNLPPKGKERIERLGEFQKNIITHCLKFPRLLRMSYSTCSLFKTENEDVIAHIIDSHGGKVELLSTFSSWKTRGFETSQLPKGQKCVRANPFVDETDGFFVSILKKRKLGPD